MGKGPHFFEVTKVESLRCCNFPTFCNSLGSSLSPTCKPATKICCLLSGVRCSGEVCSHIVHRDVAVNPHMAQNSLHLVASCSLSIVSL